MVLKPGSYKKNKNKLLVTYDVRHKSPDWIIYHIYLYVDKKSIK